MEDPQAANHKCLISIPPLPFAIERPALQSVEALAGSLRPVSCLQGSACAVDDQGSQVHVAFSGDFAQPAPFGTGSFTGSDTEPGDEMAAGRKSAEYSRPPPAGRYSSASNTVDLAHLLYPLVGASGSGQFAFDVGEFSPQVPGPL
jgi:hypothetical protein